MSLRTLGAGVLASGHWLVHGASVCVEPGRILAILGPNGAGKSTLLRLLAGDLEANVGGVCLGERDVAGLSIAELARRRAVIRQSGEVGFSYAVRDVVLLGRIPHNGGVENRDDDAVVLEVLEEVDAGHLRDRIVSTLSGGEQQRVRIARALAQLRGVVGERYLLADEPTSALDLCHQVTFGEQLVRLAADGAGVAVILHDLNLATSIADDIVLMKHGRVVHSGALGKALTPEILARVFSVDVSFIERDDQEFPFIATGAARASGHNGEMD